VYSAPPPRRQDFGLASPVTVEFLLSLLNFLSCRAPFKSQKLTGTAQNRQGNIHKTHQRRYGTSSHHIGIDLPDSLLGPGTQNFYILKA